MSVLGTGLSLLGRRWDLRPIDEAAVGALARQLALDDALARVLTGRGVVAEDVAAFLKPTLRALMPDPSRLADMDRAAARLAAAVQNGEGIAVFGDYDVDGATSSALLARFFRAVGVTATVYIPDRVKEGYGPNAPALLKLREQGAGVAITVDCGIVAFEPLRAAREAGLDVIVVDHHKAEVSLPEAAAVVNPNRLDDGSGQGHLAAVGVAFLLVVALNRTLRAAGWYNADRAEPDLMQWLDIVALGTVCDVVPLSGLNRAFVTQGLAVLARGANVGLRALMQVARVDTRPTAYHLGFLLGPRVNAGGRVGQADLGTRLLATEDPDEAAALALRLDEFNAARKEIEAWVLAEAIDQVEATADPDEPLCVVSGNWHPGVIGIVAGRLKERYDRPACVIARDGGMAKGSARSVNGVDIGRSILAAREAGLLINGGGHAMAAGLTVTEDNIPALKAFLQDDVRRQLKGAAFAPLLTLDGVLRASAVTAALVEQLSAAGPFGAGNDEPRFALVGAQIAKADVVGAGHVRCFIDGGSRRLKAIAFKSADTAVGHALLSAAGRPLHLAGTIRADAWQGRIEAQFVIDDAAWVG